MYLPALVLDDESRAELESWVRSRTIDHRYAQRARIVLMAADRVSNRDIAFAVGMHYNQVAVWRRRFAKLGLDGLADEPRPGRTPVYGHDDVILLVKFATEEPPHAARWTTEMLAGLQRCLAAKQELFDLSRYCVRVGEPGAHRVEDSNRAREQ